MTVNVSDWIKAEKGLSRYSEGTLFRHITYDCVTCSQYISDDGVKHYEFFNAKTHYKIDDFSSAQMQAVEKILYYIQSEDKLKYKLLTDETIVHNGVTLYRIQSLTDFSDVKVGDKGGWIEKEANLSHEGDAWIYDTAMVYDYAIVYDDAIVYGDAEVYDDAEVRGFSKVYGNAEVYGDAKVNRFAEVSGNAEVF